MIKYINVISLLFLLISLLSGCTKSQGIDEIYHTTNLDGIFNLSKDTLNYADNFDAESVTILDNELYTNSEQMNMSNLSEKDIIVYLYNKDDLSNEILQVTLPKFESKLVTNLSSSKIYQIGVKCQGKASIKITD